MIRRTELRRLERLQGLGRFHGAVLTIALAGCTATTVPLPLSRMDLDHVDADLVGTWQGAGMLDDFIFSTPEVVSFRVVPTRDGADVIAVRSGRKGFAWAVGHVATTDFAGDRYASIELTHASNTENWGSLEKGDIVLARYSQRAQGVMDIFFITEEGAARLSDRKTAWLKERDQAGPAERPMPEALSGILEQATQSGRDIGQETADRQAALLAILESEDEPNYFSGYYGTFARLEDITVPRLPRREESEPDNSLESAGPATFEELARRDAP